MVELTGEKIDAAAAVAKVTSAEAGAVVLFLGTTRRLTNQRETMWLDYECYAEMAEKELAAIEGEARQKWPIVGCYIVHRTGRVDLAESSVAVVVSCAHRKPAFEAAEWIMDQIKIRAPIWKQEHWADGQTEWIHPGAPNENGASCAAAPKVPSSETLR